MSFDGRLLTGVSVFLAVAEAGNFAKAAGVLGVTPSGVSRSIGRLETKMGVRLFDRTPRSVALTEEGRLFRLQALPLVAGLEEAAAAAAGSAAAVGGRLRVSIDPWFARMVLAPQLPRFTEKYPDLKIDLMTTNARDDMMSGFDVAVRFGSTSAGSLIARKLLDIRVITCAAPAYLEKFGEPGRPEDIEGYEVILFRDPETGRAFPWEFHQGTEIVTVKVGGRVVFDDPSAAVAACVAGQGLFQSLEIGLESWLQTGQITQILKDWSDEHYPLYAYHPARHLPPAKVRAFLDFVQQIAREKARQGSSLPIGETSDLLKVRETPGDPFHHPDTR
ncbi:LysR family transcriptional regulator [Rhizobium sp. 11515TR]|uniref:LysR family transcriptional regulator n=2 Tax=unclassified Rhizobium TaxID=2613769 RepID=UPI000BA83B70|nr:LysR family transcriptional regulator [Rhizobium sp. 11515TR]ASW10214.1 LysR family transcriptional regulator [Rhizobium sp. 11515TR]